MAKLSVMLQSVSLHKERAPSSNLNIIIYLLLPCKVHKLCHQRCLSQFLVNTNFSSNFNVFPYSKYADQSWVRSSSYSIRRAVCHIQKRICPQASSESHHFQKNPNEPSTTNLYSTALDILHLNMSPVLDHLLEDLNPSREHLICRLSLPRCCSNDPSRPQSS